MITDLVRLLRRQLAPYGRWLAAVALFQLVAVGAQLFLPSLNADIIDRVIAAGDTGYIWRIGAFLADPDLLILDEATSSVDTRTEVLLQKALANLRRDRTSFVIAHRLSTIRDADTILVMEDGRIVEQGDHDDLLAAGGADARLYLSQFEGAATDLDDDAHSGPDDRFVPSVA